MVGTVGHIAILGNNSLLCPIQPLVLHSNPSIEQAGLGRRATWRAPGGFWRGGLLIEMGKDLPQTSVNHYSAK